MHRNRGSPARRPSRANRRGSSPSPLSRRCGQLPQAGASARKRAGGPDGHSFHQAHPTAWTSWSFSSAAHSQRLARLLRLPSGSEMLRCESHWWTLAPQEADRDWAAVARTAYALARPRRREAAPGHAAVGATSESLELLRPREFTGPPGSGAPHAQPFILEVLSQAPPPPFTAPLPFFLPLAPTQTTACTAVRRQHGRASISFALGPCRARSGRSRAGAIGA